MSFEVKNLRKSFEKYRAVDDLSFLMKEPGVFGLLGTNGAGKTTTLRMILGMLSKDQGEILWEGKEFDTEKIGIGYLAEERGIYSKVTVVDQLVYFGELKGLSKEKAMESVDYWLGRLKIVEHKNKTAEKLSKGNQQKVQFIAALIGDPKILILDEPLSGLDPVNTDVFKDVIKEELSKGKYIIMSSHQMSTVEEFCTDLVILKKGKTIVKGNLREIKRSYGRNNLTIKCDEDISEIINNYNMTLVTSTAEEATYKIKDENVALKLLKELVEKNIHVVKFELKEPTLHEIFIEKVGDINEK